MRATVASGAGAADGKQLAAILAQLVDLVRMVAAQCVIVEQLMQQLEVRADNAVDIKQFQHKPRINSGYTFDATFGNERRALDLRAARTPLLSGPET